MKVLHAAETIKGGVATVIRLLANDDDYKRCVESSFLVPDSHVSELGDTSRFSVFTFRYRRRGVASSLRFAFAFVMAVLRQRPDVVHLHSSFAGFIGRLALIVLRPIASPKIVYCPHAFSFLMEGVGNKKSAFLLLEKILASRTDAIICVSEYERSTAISLGMPKECLCVIHNGVPQRSPSVDSIQNDPNVIRLLFVGRFDRQKGFDVMMNAYDKLPVGAFTLTVVGASVLGDKIFFEPKDGVRYCGWLGPDGVEKEILNSDLVVVPSRWEGFAMVPLEAMALGRAVVCSDASSLPEVVVDDRNGRLFKSENAIDLSLILLNVTKSDCARWGREALNVHKESFTSSAMAKKTIAVYKRMLSAY